LAVVLERVAEDEERLDYIKRRAKEKISQTEGLKRAAGFRSQYLASSGRVWRRLTEVLAQL
jgi:hypothetical protein